MGGGGRRQEEVREKGSEVEGRKMEKKKIQKREEKTDGDVWGGVGGCLPTSLLRKQ